MIIPNADSSEKDSPFYSINKSFCDEFEKFIIEHKGKFNGNYNAWSYLIYGKIIEPKEWILEYKKSTFSSGNLLLSAKKQNLFVSAIWKTKIHKTSNTEFTIRKRKFIDSILKLFNQNISNLESHQNYVLITKKKSADVQNLIQILQNLFISKEIYQISQINKELKIELRTDKHYFDIFSQLTKVYN